MMFVQFVFAAARDSTGTHDKKLVRLYLG